MSDQSMQQVYYRPVPGYPDYRVGDDGTVWTRKVRGSSIGRIGPWCKMKPGRGDGSYFQVVLYVDKKAKTFRVHHLVLLSFGFDRPEPKAETRHFDGDTLNNRLSNLSWGTAKQNSDDKRCHGTILRGDKSGLSKLTEKEVIEIRDSLNHLSNQEVAAIYHVTYKHVWLIRKRRTWKHLS